MPCLQMATFFLWKDFLDLIKSNSISSHKYYLSDKIQTGYIQTPFLQNLGIDLMSSNIWLSNIKIIFYKHNNFQLTSGFFKILLELPSNSMPSHEIIVQKLNKKCKKSREFYKCTNIFILNSQNLRRIISKCSPELVNYYLLGNINFSRDLFLKNNFDLKRMKGQGQGERDQKKHLIRDGEEKRSLEYRVQILESLLEEKGKKIDQLDAAVYTLNLATRRTDQEIQQAVKKIQNLDTETLRLTKVLGEQLKQAQALRKEQLQKLNRSLSSEVVKVQKEILKKIPKPQNEEIGRAIKDLWQQFQEVNNKVTELIETKNQKLSMLPAVPRKKYKKQNLSGNNTVEKLAKMQVDLTTPYVDQFQIKGNNIVHKGIIWGCYQILMNTVIRRKETYIFCVQIVNINGGIVLGVIDRLTQRMKQSSLASGNFVGYGSRSGFIYCSKDGRFEYNQTNQTLQAGMKVQVKVNLQKGTVGFTFIKHTQTKYFQQYSDILTQENREFVPSFEMLNRGDSIRWIAE